MKTFKNSMTKLFLVSAMSFAFVFGFSSCEENADKQAKPGQSKQENEPKTLKASNIDRDVLNAMKNIEIVGPVGQKRAKNNSASPDDFSFSDPSSGYQYSEGGNVSLEYSRAEDQQYSDRTPTLRVSGPGFSQGGGILSVGRKDIKTDYVFCASMENAFSLFEGGADTSEIGFSVIIGINGDLNALQDGNGSDSTGHGQVNQLVYFIVYDDNARGNYSVAELFADNHRSPKNLAFAIAFDLESESFYLSSQGKINVQGSSMAFNGKMFEFTAGSLILSGDETEDVEPRQVNANGTLNCSN